MAVSQKDVARMVGVSAMTVSRVINNSPHVKPETRKKILEAIKKLNYYPNAVGRALQRGYVETIGIIIPFASDIFSIPYFSELLAGIEIGCAKNSFNLIFQTQKYEEGFIDYKKLYKERKVDGLIIIAPPINCPEIEDLNKERVPFVVIDGRASGKNISYVDADNFLGAKLAVKHLLELGHKRIGFISGWDYVSNGKDRLEGYKSALKENHIPFDERLIFMGDFSEAKGFEAIKYFVSLKERPTAIFAANDLMAIGALRALNSMNIKVPEDISIVGFDDIKISQYISPPLTTVRQPVREMGEKAAEILINKIKYKTTKNDKIIFPTELVIRKSTAPIK